MYLLQHCVNLSRRACRVIVVLLALATIANSIPRKLNDVSGGGGGASSDSLMYPKPDLDPLPQDFNAPYEGVQFGPMGPTKRDSSEPSKLAAPTVLNTEPPPQTEEHKPERYQIASVEFHRVETPFIIGLWIFCASLAKIGKSFFQILF